MNKIIHEIAAHYGVDLTSLRQTGGNQYPRFIAAYLGSQRGLPLEVVGTAVGMSPSAVYLAAKSIARKVKVDEFSPLKDDLAEIEARLMAPPPRVSTWTGTATRSFTAHRTFSAPRSFTNSRSFAPTRSYAQPKPVRAADPAYVTADTAFFRSHRFVIDALNVCYFGNGNKKGNHPVLANIVAVTRELDRMGAEWVCFWDPFNSNRFVKPEERRLWERLMNDPRHVQVKGMKADLAVLMAASKPSRSGRAAILITNDKYRSEALAYNFPIAFQPDRFLRGTKVGDEIWFPAVQWVVKVA